MKNAFEDKFKAPKNECSLSHQLSQMIKEMHKPMREFDAKFNRLIQRIPATSRPNAENQKTFFVNGVPLDVSFHIIKDVVAAQRLAIQLEDAFINDGKWRREVQTTGTASSSAPTNPIMQKLMNDVAMMKRQKNKTHAPYLSPYQDIHTQQQPQNFGKTPTLTTPQTRLQCVLFT